MQEGGTTFITLIDALDDLEFAVLAKAFSHTLLMFDMT